MNIELQTRTEHSRSIEDAELYRSLETLKEVGLLLPVTGMQTFHGRVGAGNSDAWTVDPYFAQRNRTNGNVHNRPALYTSDRQTADHFAMERTASKTDEAVDQYFLDTVRRYNPEQREAWLGRLNASQLEWWNSLSSSQQAVYPNGPKYKTPADFRNLLYAEAKRLQGTTSQQDRDSIRKDAAENIHTEVHEIVTADTDATVVDLSIDEESLGPRKLEARRQALKALTLPLTEGSPLNFEDRDAGQPFVQTIMRLQMPWVKNGDVARIVQEAGIDEKTALQLASSYNAQQFIPVQFTQLITGFMASSADIFTHTVMVNGERLELPINAEYIERFLRNAHIVGVKQRVYSATLGRAIEPVAYFDLAKVTTLHALESKRQTLWQKLGELAEVSSNRNNSDVASSHELVKLAEVAHAKPEKLVDAAMRVDDRFKALFQSDTGNWERFTLAEHTETVLRNFEENYAETLPVQILPLMRLAILVHDIGKPLAAARSEKHKQKEYNVPVANNFLTKIGVDANVKEVILAVIGDGEELAYQIEVRHAGEQAQAAMRQLAVKSLDSLIKPGPVTDAMIDGFIELCKILQVCDGGAYTRMATTRRRDKGGIYRNYPSFDSTFEKPVGPGKRDLNLRRTNDN